MVIGRETPDSSASAFMARDWILTFGAPCAAPGPARTREAARGAHTACPPACAPARRGKGRFTYGVYLQESLEVPMLWDLTVRQPLNDLAGDLGFLQA